jgi:lipid-binding SYLF domain-containing protein
VRQGSIGVQLGGQSFQQIIFFQEARTLSNFKVGKFEFAANASAVAVRRGAAASADYEQGVAVFVAPKGGLMFEASIGGQKFAYEAMD